MKPYLFLFLSMMGNSPYSKILIQFLVFSIISYLNIGSNLKSFIHY